MSLLQKEVALCKQEGIDLTTPIPKPKRDAGPLLRQLFQSLQFRPDSPDPSAWFMARNAGKLTVEALERDRKTLALLAKVGECDGSTYLPDSPRYSYATTDLAKPVSRLMALCMVKAEWESRKGKPVDAVHTLGEITKTLNLIYPQDRFAMLFKRAAASDSVGFFLHKLIQRHGTDPQVRQECRSVLAHLLPSINLQEVAKQEAIWGWNVVQTGGYQEEQYYDEAEGENPIATKPRLNRDLIWNLRAEGTRAALLTGYLRYYRSLVKNYPKDPEDFAEMTKPSPASPSASGRMDLVYGLGRGYDGWQYSEIVPVLEHRRLLQIEIAMLDRYAQAPSWPVKIPRDLGISVFDPFNHLLLHYKPSPNGFMLYSVGPNGRDEGGLEQTNMLVNRTDGDIVVRFPFPSTAVRKAP